MPVFLFVVAIIIGTIWFLSDNSNRKKQATKNMGEKSAGGERTKANDVQCEPEPDRSIEEDVDLFVEILPNLYSLSLSNVALKRHRTYKNGKKTYDYVTLKCKVNYRLNGRKEGKRYIIFTGYDEKGRVVTVRGKYDKYHFTEVGFEILEICFDDFISRISVSVREL